MIRELVKTKKLFTMLLIAALSVSCLAGYGNSEPAETETTSMEETQQAEGTSEPEAAVEKVSQRHSHAKKVPFLHFTS